MKPPSVLRFIDLDKTLIRGGELEGREWDFLRGISGMKVFEEISKTLGNEGLERYIDQALRMGVNRSVSRVLSLNTQTQCKPSPDAVIITAQDPDFYKHQELKIHKAGFGEHNSIITESMNAKTEAIIDLYFRRRFLGFDDRRIQIADDKVQVIDLNRIQNQTQTPVTAIKVKLQDQYGGTILEDFRAAS